MNIASPEVARVVKRKRARSTKPGRDATRPGGGKGPTKGGAPCVIQRRGMPWAMRNLEAIEGEQV